MKKLFLSILVICSLLSGNAYAETAKEQASRLLMNKFKFAIEGVLFALIFTGIAFVVAKIIKILFKKNIIYSNFYIHSFIAGFILRIIILALIK
jgi:hypothetical protein